MAELRSLGAHRVTGTPPAADLPEPADLPESADTEELPPAPGAATAATPGAEPGPVIPDYDFPPPGDGSALGSDDTLAGEFDDGAAGVSDDRSALESAVVAGGAAAKALWLQASTLIPLLAALSYGVGRLMVDGFYAQLHTTAEAAGLGYAAIVEPAAVLTAGLAIVGAAFVIVFDALQVLARKILGGGRKVMLWLDGIGILGLFSTITLAGKEGVFAFLPLALLAIRTLVDRFGTAKDQRAAAKRVRDDMSGLPSPAELRFTSDMAQKVLYVVLALTVLASFCVGAHELGVHEGQRAASGKSVDLSVLGLAISSIGATPVHVQAIDQSPAVRRVAAIDCMLQIGSGPSDVLLYDPASREILTLPYDQIVVASSRAACRD